MPQELSSDLLKAELDMIATIDPSAMEAPNKVDMFVALSGRGDFTGNLVEADRLKFIANGRECDLVEIDTEDTIHRMAATISIAKKYYNKTKKCTPIYFNGTTEQNKQLRDILKTQTSYMGYPSLAFIVDDIPMPNTVGQGIGLRFFVETHPDLFSENPYLLFVTNTYHTPRVLRTFGMDSPLLTPEFYEGNPEIMAKLSAPIAKHVLQSTCAMQRAIIMAYGCDRDITSRRGWKKDLLGDIEASIKYSTVQNPPSIAARISDNCLTQREAILGANLNESRILCHLYRRALKQQETSFSNHTEENLAAPPKYINTQLMLPELPKDNYLRACSLYERYNYEEALVLAHKCKEEIDANPYPVNSEKGVSGFKAFEVGMLVAHCYKKLNQNQKAIVALEDVFYRYHGGFTENMEGKMENALTAWKAELSDKQQANPPKATV